MSPTPTNNGLNMLRHGWSKPVSAHYCPRQSGQSSNTTTDHLKFLCASGGCLDGGVVTACAKIGLAIESTSLGLCVLWGLSVDFAKMFNTLSPHVAAAWLD